MGTKKEKKISIFELKCFKHLKKWNLPTFHVVQ